MSYETILTERKGDGPLQAGIITLNRPAQLNALSDTLMTELGDALKRYDLDDSIGCVILTGSAKAFAAGADISEMADFTHLQAFRDNFITRNWEVVTTVRKPVIAAIGGFALGGGCELAMMCDIVIAADTAKFGQPEIKLGVIPGAGGTQRLPRAVGKAKAMDMVLTARLIDAVEAERIGLVSRIVPAEQLMDEALSVAAQICRLSLPSIMLAKECVDRAYESTLVEGVRFERRAFHSLFGTADQREGMSAFLEKRKPAFRHG
ncbi:MAG: enoyl-CoA hydratase [Rhodocyclaceae bacterium]|nr:enoyl-CoA hydratase [Rhodocyclaceae bacterium]MBX3667704.1 enoyl-CoA hydratase [Rhodocyclaceae bacterium]